MKSEENVVEFSFDVGSIGGLPTGTMPPCAEVKHVPTGITSLDKELGGGIRAGTLGVICGFTGDGKSSFVVHLAQTAASFGHPVRIYHYEMTPEDYLSRLKAWETGVAYSKISGVNSRDFPLIQIVSLRSNRYCGAAAIAADIQTLKAEHDLTPVIIVDSLDGLESERLRLEFLANSLADLAERAGAVIWGTSQANSKVTTVTLEHLRETTGKSFPCSLFIGLGKCRADDEGSEVVLTVAKNRYGSSFQVRVRAQLEYQRFSDVNDTYQLPRTEADPEERQICGPGDKSGEPADESGNL